MEIKVDALVLRTADYGEADKMLTLFTLQEGKLSAAAKGVRTIHANNYDEIAGFLARAAAPGDAVLFKGSRGMALENAIEKLSALQDAEARAESENGD